MRVELGVAYIATESLLKHFPRVFPSLYLKPLAVIYSPNSGSIPDVTQTTGTSVASTDDYARPQINEIFPDEYMRGFFIEIDFFHQLAFSRA